MIRLNDIRRLASIVIATGIVLAACSSAESHRSGDGRLGQARVSIEEAPDDVHCVKIAAAGSLVSTRTFDTSPGESALFELEALPFGEVAFSGEAFPEACSELTDDSAPHWVADPVSATLEPGVVADVALSMHRNGQAAVGVDFAADGTCANGVQDGSESGPDCGGDCLPCGEGTEPSGGGDPSPEPSGTFVFSEYVEGSSTYKALEITALEDGSLEGCQVAMYFNGGTTANGVALAGSLLAGESYVLCSSALGSLISVCDQTAGLTFNGDDAITLECDGAVLDTIGQIGFDPGTAWGSGDLSLLDHTLRRECEGQGDTNTADAFDPAGEWTGHASDSFEDLGVRSCP